MCASRGICLSVSLLCMQMSGGGWLVGGSGLECYSSGGVIWNQVLRR